MEETTQSLEVTKQQMISEVEWHISYHERKLTEYKNQLEIIKNGH